MSVALKSTWPSPCTTYHSLKNLYSLPALCLLGRLFSPLLPQLSTFHPWTLISYMWSFGKTYSNHCLTLFPVVKPFCIRSCVANYSTVREMLSPHPAMSSLTSWVLPYYYLESYHQVQCLVHSTHSVSSYWIDKTKSQQNERKKTVGNWESGR